MVKYTRFNNDGNSARTSFNKERTGRTRLIVCTSALFVPKGGKKGQSTALSRASISTVFSDTHTTMATTREGKI